MKRIWMCFFFALLTFAAFADPTAVFKEVSGKVEVRSGTSAWVPAKVGMTIATGSVISTSFKAKATLALGDSVVLVKQLTRMRLEELIEREGTVSTSLYLDVGKVTAEVKTASGKKNDFRLRSPISTAAVRGTTIEFSPDTVFLIEGSASAYNALGKKVYVPRGGTIRFERGFGYHGLEDNDKVEFNVNPYTGDRGGASKGKIVRGVAAVIISLEWQ
jgi:hypothetical protein